MTRIMEEQKELAITFLRQMNDVVEGIDDDGVFDPDHKIPTGLIPLAEPAASMFKTIIYQDPLFRRIAKRFNEKTGLRLTIVGGNGELLLDASYVFGSEVPDAG